MTWLRRHAWGPAVFLLALALRVGFAVVYDQPLLFTHQYTYFNGALRIAQHPEPWSYILRSDEWRAWDVHWTIAPLYFVFAGLVLRLSELHLLPLQLIQCGLDALVAVLVARLGRAFAGPRGAWAGVAYALYWTAVELPSWTMTENLHTPLLVAGALLAAHDARPNPLAPRALRRLFAAGVFLGISALARSVSSAFLLLLGALQVVRHGRRCGAFRGAILVAGGLLMILPWSARNALVLGEWVPIETTMYENLVWANHLGEREGYKDALAEIARQPDPAAKRAVAVRVAWDGIRSHPGRFVAKVWSNFWHFIRPDGLDGLLRAERSVEPWGHLKTILGDDLLLLVVVPLCLVFLVAGRASPARDVVVVWSAYYLTMVVVVFHNEVRYRTALAPFALAAAAGGAALLGDPAQRRSWRARVALGLGLGLVATSLAPYVGPAWRLASAGIALRAADLGDERDAEVAAARAPRSAWPWTWRARALAHAGRAGHAVAAYQRADEVSTPVHIAPALALARLQGEAGRPAQAALAVRRADALSWSQDPWFLLEIAWAELPAPRADSLDVGAGTGDYGAVRGFFHPRGGDPRLARGRLWSDYARLGGDQPPPGAHRWSRSRAWLRLVPLTTAPRYDLTLWMGSPFPSPLAAPVVTLSCGGSTARFTLTRDVAPYTLRVAAPPPSAPLVVRLDSPTWTRLGEPAGQGVRVERMSTAPAP